jgi:hypothetical protein
VLLALFGKVVLLWACNVTPQLNADSGQMLLGVSTIMLDMKGA